MTVSLNFIVRIIGMLVFATLGRSIGTTLSSLRPTDMEIFATQLLMLSGAGLGLLATPHLTLYPIRDLLRRARTVPLIDILLVAAGGMIGLIFGALLALPVSMLDGGLGRILPIGVSIFLFYVGANIAHARRRDIVEVLRQWRQKTTTFVSDAKEATTSERRYVLDTSAIIDGRIEAVVQTGFMEGKLIVPGFVLIELQDLADSSDDLRRSKGRRGLELLNEMQQHSPLPIEVMNIEVSNTTRVDDKLVVVARQLDCPIITNDFNLNRVAGLQGIKVLSLNQLSEAVRPPVAQDEQFQVVIRNEGNMRQQGVGYLEDGTPVFVEDARHLIGQLVDVVVTRIHQTQSGRLIFAQVSPHFIEKKTNDASRTPASV